MKYNELLKKIKKDLEPFIIQLIREQTDPMKNIDKGLQALDMLKESNYIGKFMDLFSGKKDNEFDAENLKTR